MRNLAGASHGALAHLGERNDGIVEVAGSRPAGSTNQIRPGAGWRGKHPSDLVHGGMAKLERHLVLIQEIVGSSPTVPTTSFRSKGKSYFDVEWIDTCSQHRLLWVQIPPIPERVQALPEFLGMNPLSAPVVKLR